MLNVLVTIHHSNGVFKASGYMFPKPTDQPQADVQALIDKLQNENGAGNLNYITLYGPGPTTLPADMRTVSAEEFMVPSAVLTQSVFSTVIVEV